MKIKKTHKKGNRTPTLTFKNRELISEATYCGCSFCKEVFTPDKIEKWVDGGETAVCPFCGMESVIGSKEVISVSSLEYMNKR